MKLATTASSGPKGEKSEKPKESAGKVQCLIKTERKEIFNG